jgi:3',5'-cyclic AMP phosphodiesterase CpdA
MNSLAHLSDLHLGANRTTERAARALVDALAAEREQHVVITGDVTHRGRRDEYALFREVIAPLERAGRVTIVPGNHDRMGDDIGSALAGGRRVWTESSEGLHLVCVDSTAPHNRVKWRCHGDICDRVLADVDAALAAAPASATVAVLLHHHPLPLPEETFAEHFAKAVGWPFTAELHLGQRLLANCLGRADLVLHGHRHVPRHFSARASNGRELVVLNAGSSTEMRAWRSIPLAQPSRTQWHRLDEGQPHPALSAPPAPLVLSPAFA